MTLRSVVSLTTGHLLYFTSFLSADYHRTQLTFAVLSLLLMLLSLSSAFYTFKNGRYMYKRLAAGLYFISGQFANYKKTKVRPTRDFLQNLQSAID